MTTHRTTPSRVLRTIKLGGALFTLAVAIVVTFGVMAHLGPSHPGAAAAGPTSAVTHGQKGHATCDLPGQPKCPPNDRHWVTVASTSPNDILAAMQSSPAYMTPPNAASAPGGSAYSFDAPVLVLPATTRTRLDVDSMPHYIVCASINGVRRVTYELTYDPAHKQLYIGSIGIELPNDPHYGKPFPWDGVTASVALSKLQAAHQMSAGPGVRPQLVYFSPDPKIAQPGLAHPWAGGGSSASEAIWRIKGADGRLYFVGIDSVVYTAAQLPIEPGATVAQV